MLRISPVPGQGPLGQARPHQFIDQHGSNKGQYSGPACRRSHPARRLWHTYPGPPWPSGQQRDAQGISGPVRGCGPWRRTGPHPGIYPMTGRCYIPHTGQEHSRIAEDQLQRRAAENKEQSNGRADQRSACSISSSLRGQKLQNTVPSIMQTSREENRRRRNLPGSSAG